MQSYIEMLAESIDVAAIAILAVFFPFFVLFTVRAIAGCRFPLRAIHTYDRIRGLVSQAAESGRTIHVGMGSGRIGTESTPEVLMGLTVFDFVARNAATYDQSVSGTAGDPTVFSSAQGILQRARVDAGTGHQPRLGEVSFSGPDGLAYAAGTRQALQGIAGLPVRHLASVLVGRFGAEGLWISEAASDQELIHLGGTSDPAASALMHATLDASLIGEDLFAAGAYLHRPSHLGSLAVQDFMRVIIILSLVVGALLASLGYMG